MKNILPIEILEIAIKFRQQGINMYVVGGSVRDFLLGIESSDIDFCLENVNDTNVVNNILGEFGGVTVSARFPCWMCFIEGEKYDFALARHEKSVGDKRQDFDVFTENVSIEEDLFRRDITINAIAYCINNDRFIDPFGGINDLKNKICRNVSTHFNEDALRVIRSARFIAKYDLTPTKEFIEICKGLTPLNISNDRVGKELVKLFESDCLPSKFFNFLREIDWLKYHFIELSDLIGIEQNPVYHPEGDAYNHTMLCMDFANKIAPNDVMLKLVMLCHDLGKATKTTNVNGKIQAIGHEYELHLTDNLLNRLQVKNLKYYKKIKMLVSLHMIHTKIISDKVIKSTMRKLETVGLTYDVLHNICLCDRNGKGASEFVDVDIRKEDAIFDIAQIVTGDMLKEIGLKPSKEFNDIILKSLELQDKGVLNRYNWFKVLKGIFPVFKSLK